MLESFKRIFSGSELVPEWNDASEWAGQRGYGAAPMDGGFALDGHFLGKPWQLEWAPSQRPFIAGNELRMQIEAGTPKDMHMMLISAPLMKALEKQAFERFTQGMQTQVDESSPEETRWLVMFAKADLAPMGGVAEHFGAVGNSPAQTRVWVEGPLAILLQRAAGVLLAAGAPFVLMVSRGRATMRLQMSEVSPPLLGSAISLFETAVGQALKVPLIRPPTDAP